MMALYHRDVHGATGQLIDINLIDPLARLLEQTLLGYDQLGLVPTRAGNRWDNLRRRATPTALPRSLAGDVGQLTAVGAEGLFRAIGARPTWSTTPTSFRSARAGWRGPARSTRWSPTGCATKTLAEGDGHLRCRRGGRRTGLRHHRSGLPTSTLFAPRSLRQRGRRRTGRDDRPGSGCPPLSFRAIGRCATPTWAQRIGEQQRRGSTASCSGWPAATSMTCILWVCL